MDPDDFYGIRGVSFTGLRRELGWLCDAPHPEEERLSRAIGSALLHGDDPDRLRALAAALSAPAPPELHTLGERERRTWLMLTVQLFGTGRQWRPLAGRRLAPGTAPAAGAARRTRRSPPPPPALGAAGAAARARPLQPPFVCLGFARYESHVGERPLAIRWRLEREIPAAWLPVMGLAV